MSLLSETVSAIRPACQRAVDEADARQARLTKPPGSMGQLEDLGAQLAGIARTCPPPVPARPAVAVFAGDHGVHAQGVTPWPQEVTAQMVANLAAGGAVVNALARQVGASVSVVDVGVAADLPDAPNLLQRKVARGTRDLAEGSAMTRQQAQQALETGIAVAGELVDGGADLLVTGDMGIANTTPSAALIAGLTRSEPADVTGRGTGIDDETLRRKTAVVERALDRLDRSEPLAVLAEVGGLEHVSSSERRPAGCRSSSTASSPSRPRSSRARWPRTPRTSGSPATSRWSRGHGQPWTTSAWSRCSTCT
jgi:nicotinate-nucleotide--dimethylbenzimidazole phosphoribosyltransferase